jgi:hypothetical protein
MNKSENLKKREMGRNAASAKQRGTKHMKINQKKSDRDSVDGQLRRNVSHDSS